MKKSENRLKGNGGNSKADQGNIGGNVRENDNKLVKSDSFNKISFLKRFTRQNSLSNKRNNLLAMNPDIMEVNGKQNRKGSDSQVKVLRKESTIQGPPHQQMQINNNKIEVAMNNMGKPSKARLS